MVFEQEYERLIVTSDEKQEIAYITLNRAEKRNALDIVLLEEYNSVLEGLQNSQYKVIVTRGAGPSFCAGMDLHKLKEWAQEWDQGVYAWSDAGPLSKALRLLREHSAITVASVHGYCAGGGLALVVAHDLAIAADDAQFILPETERGSFGALAAAAIHYAIPTKRAFDMQLFGSALSGQDAIQLGLVSRSVPAEELEEATQHYVEAIATRDRNPLTHAKMARYLNEGRNFDETMRVDLLVRTRQDVSRNSFEDVSGFLAKRKTSD